jgi:excinuclease ABC subunit A
VENLIASLRRLADRGATIVVVEHDEQMVAAANWEVRLGPGAGPEGGKVVYEGPPEVQSAGDEARTVSSSLSDP